MITIIIAGGSGTRLWPLSTPDYPKHLLSLTGERSLLQDTYERAKAIGDAVYVISESSHAKHVKEQLPELTDKAFIIEPGRRGTASCIVSALHYMSQNHDKDEPIVFMHADSHIRDTRGFTDSVKVACAMTKKYHKIVLLGVEPSYPATGFGYIECGENTNGGKAVYEVKSFKEKPDYATAEKYIASGRYLWNMGFFVATLHTFEHAIKTYAPQLWANHQKLLGANNEKEYKKYYLDFKSEPIDIALIEKVPDLLVTLGSFDWMDVGSFPDVHQVNTQDENGNSIQGKIAVENVSNSIIRNDTKLPVAVIGLDNVAVVINENGGLVTNKSHAQKVGEVSKRFGAKS